MVDGHCNDSYRDTNNRYWEEEITYDQTMRVLLVVVNLGVSAGILMSFSMIMLVIYKQVNLKLSS